mmetsp:Transcript_106784/g.267657  ORF Transcript_106784/g.267657 Transcript_106784/m.267657 type:complete len:205 (-) Transcript_106784:308-922(-)
MDGPSLLPSRCRLAAYPLFKLIEEHGKSSSNCGGRRSRNHVFNNCVTCGYSLVAFVTMYWPVRERISPKVSLCTHCWPSGNTFCLVSFFLNIHKRSTDKTSRSVTRRPSFSTASRTTCAVRSAKRRPTVISSVSFPSLNFCASCKSTPRAWASVNALKVFSARVRKAVAEAGGKCAKKLSWTWRCSSIESQWSTLSLLTSMNLR